MKKRAHNSKARPSLSRKSHWRDILFERGIIVKKPITDEQRANYGQSFVEWCHQRKQEEDLKKDSPLPFYIEEWLVQEGIPLKTHNLWLNCDEAYAEYFKQGCLVLGTHQESGAAVKKFSEGTIHKNLRHYLPRWSNNDEYEDGRKKDLQKHAAESKNESPEEVHLKISKV